MKVAVTATEPSLDAVIEPRFGRCPCFVIVDTDSMNCEGVENDSAALASGAGIQSAQLLAEKGVQAVLTGNCGPNAYQTLSAAAIAMITDCQGTVREAVEQFKAGRLHESGGPNVASHFGASPTSSSEQTLPPAGDTGPGMGLGTGAGMGRGRGAGMGRGRGGGMGRGRGGGMGRGGGRQGWGFGRGMAADGPSPGAPTSTFPSTPSANPPSPVDAQALKQQADALAAQLHEIQNQLDRMKKEE